VKAALKGCLELGGILIFRTEPAPSLAQMVMLILTLSICPGFFCGVLALPSGYTFARTLVFMFLLCHIPVLASAKQHSLTENP
jgi:hypothetical protein